MSDNKTPRSLMPALYSHRINEISTIGRACGYAMAVHGSMQRDLDVVAVPWTERATSALTLVRMLCNQLGVSRSVPTLKPHGRITYTLLLGGACFMDLSITPRRKRP